MRASQASPRHDELVTLPCATRRGSWTPRDGTARHREYRHVFSPGRGALGRSAILPTPWSELVVESTLQQIQEIAECPRRALDAPWLPRAISGRPTVRQTYPQILVSRSMPSTMPTVRNSAQPTTTRAHEHCDDQPMRQQRCSRHCPGHTPTTHRDSGAEARLIYFGACDHKRAAMMQFRPCAIAMHAACCV